MVMASRATRFYEDPTRRSLRSVAATLIPSSLFEKEKRPFEQTLLDKPAKRY